MPANQIEKLGTLLESQNRLLRQEAVNTLSKLPIASYEVENILNKYLYGHEWGARLASAEIVENMLKNLKKENACEEFPFSLADVQEISTSIQQLDLFFIEQNFRHLLECDDGFYEMVGPSRTSFKEQRNLIDRHLDLNPKTGLSSHSFLSDEEISNTSSQGQSFEHHKKSIAADPFEFETNSKSHILLPTNCEKQDESKPVYGDFTKFFNIVLKNFTDNRWYVRHGAALALGKIIAHLFEWLNAHQLESLIIKMLEILVLDRFDDFVTGNNAIAPVREVAAQAMSALLLKIAFYLPSHPNCQSLFATLCQKFTDMLSFDTQWQCRQAALAVCKYYFSACSFDANSNKMADMVLGAVNDKIDEVVSSAISALAIFLDNARIESDSKQKLMKHSIDAVWGVLQDRARFEQLKEGLDAILICMVQLINSWLKGQYANAFLNYHQSEILLDMCDHKFPSRTKQVIECINTSLMQKFDCNSMCLFSLTKMIYRLLLFVPESDLKMLATSIFSTLDVLIRLCEMQNHLQFIIELHANIGYWISCILYEHRVLEIDVYQHRVDGPNSQKESPFEQFCGDDIRFLKEDEINALITERKIILAKFLGPLVNLIYYSGIEGSSEAIQELFIPLLKTNSLYRRFGSSYN